MSSDEEGEKAKAMEFHISRNARDFYRFDDSLYGFNGNVIFPHLLAVRVFVQRMNEKRDLLHYPELAISASDVHAMGLIDEILHAVVSLYHEQIHPLAMRQALQVIQSRFGRERVDQALLLFLEEFPPLSVYRGAITPSAYLQGETRGVPHRVETLEEMVLLGLANANPAFSPFQELFSDSRLRRQSAYEEILDAVESFFETQPRFGPDDQPLILMLRSPALAHPYSLHDQLEYIRTRWGKLLGRYLYDLLRGLDLMAEEKRMRMGGPGPIRGVDLTGLHEAVPRYGPEQAWMHSVVLLAKNTYVWLDQLSRKYGRTIRRLDQIPEEELDQIARWGFNALWLIGVWERSSASRRIKQLCGNPEAEASAYALYDYTIAQELGGEEAFETLKARALKRGIRLAGDMVPNHVGIDGRWVIEHPERLMTRKTCPFPSYTFNGPNLSSDDRVAIFLEDHYYTRTDAAVVFKRVDQWTGETLYVYHGNDGTHMPWNDTAQLDFLNSETRAAVIEEILRVARRFPIIRFDAAMTLVKQHIQRLWYPEPGTGGAIPSRSEYGLSAQAFHAAMPQEFWREVVDRVTRDAPDTLLLAEAFWLLEGYFVRTLGMHRVYNSAFMNMLKAEQNAQYRGMLKEILAFDPEILRRFVNFMSNPDEEPAAVQFGKGEKYFGICVLLSTMPGLPMFGHGQVEGFGEKYGMEYRRAYWNEEPDPWFVGRHEREIFPLLKRRSLFSGISHFYLYDFFTPEGVVDENVFAFSNREGEERALVLYNNAPTPTHGWIRLSTAFRPAGVSNSSLIQKTLGEGLALSTDPRRYTLFRDLHDGLEYIRSNQALHDEGLEVTLGPYGYHVFLDFREVHDGEAHLYKQLHDYLNGRGVMQIEEALSHLFMSPLQKAVKDLLQPLIFLAVIEGRVDDPLKRPNIALLEDFGRGMDRLAEEVCHVLSLSVPGSRTGEEAKRALAVLLEMPMWKRYPALARQNALQEVIAAFLADPVFSTAVFYPWIVFAPIGRLQDQAPPGEAARSWIDEWRLGRILADALTDIPIEASRRDEAELLIRILIRHAYWEEKFLADSPLPWILGDPEIQAFIKIHRFQGSLLYDPHLFEELIRFLAGTALISILSRREKKDARPLLRVLNTWTRDLMRRIRRSGMCMEALRKQDAEKPQG